MVRAASSYASQHEQVLTFGLGAPSRENPSTVDVEVIWPGGTSQLFPGLARRRLHVLHQSP